MIDYTQCWKASHKQIKSGKYFASTDFVSSLVRVLNKVFIISIYTSLRATDVTPQVTEVILSFIKLFITTLLHRLVKVIKEVLILCV